MCNSGQSKCRCALRRGDSISSRRPSFNQLPQRSPPRRRPYRRHPALRPVERLSNLRRQRASERACAPEQSFGRPCRHETERQSVAHLIHSIHSSDPLDPPDPLVRCRLAADQEYGRLTADYYLSPRVTRVRSNPVYLFSDWSPRSDQRTKSARTGLGRGRPRSDR